MSRNGRSLAPMRNEELFASGLAQRGYASVYTQAIAIGFDRSACGRATGEPIECFPVCCQRRFIHPQPQAGGW